MVTVVRYIERETEVLRGYSLLSTQYYMSIQLSPCVKNAFMVLILQGIKLIA